MSKSIFRHQGQNIQTNFVDYDPDTAVLAYMDSPEITDVPDSYADECVEIIDNKGGNEIEENPLQRRCKTNDIHSHS